MSKRLFFWWGFGLIVTWNALCAQRPPNIIVIMVDDMGYADIGPFGATQQKTPALDRMAHEGMRLTSFYAAAVCSPSRAQLMTGCYQARISVPHVYFPGNPNGLNTNEVTVAQHLKRLGYATACIGKWHLGDQPEFLPTRRGFDSYFGFPYSNDMLKKNAAHERVVPLMRNETVEALLTEEEQSGIVARYTEEAVRFIRAKKEQPFFLYFPHTAVHTPIHPGKAFAGRSNNGRYGDWVEEVDWSTGRILDTLRELKLDGETLVLFTSDNGPWLIKGSDGGSALPLRGGKGSTWEGGVRVPTLAWWPGHVPAGSRCDAVLGQIDVLPTCVALAGGRVPAEPVIDGRDCSQNLLGVSNESPREAHYYFLAYELQAVRQGPWKLALTRQSDLYGGKTRKIQAEGVRLYNLDRDIGETNNCAGDHPDIVARLRALAAAKDAEIGGKQPTARRPEGCVTQAKMLYDSPEDPHAKARVAMDPVDFGKLRCGDTLSGSAAPRVAQSSFDMTLRVETAQSNCVLLAHGGVSVGYAVHLRNQRVVFSVRTAPTRVISIQSERPFVSGSILRVCLKKDQAMVLFLDGQEVARGHADALLPQQPMEDFCLGVDTRKPVVETFDNTPLVGRIDGVLMRVGAIAD